MARRTDDDGNTVAHDVEGATGTPLEGVAVPQAPAEADTTTAATPTSAPPIEASSAAKAPDTQGGEPQTITTSVWAPTGPIAKALILQTAIQSVRDAIPVVFELKAEIDAAACQKKTLDDGRDGTEFVVNITYTPRKVAGSNQDAVDLDKVIKSLEVPRSIDTHAGDPDFLKHD